MRTLIFSSLIFATPVAAQEAMTGQDFLNFTTGRTFIAEPEGGEPYGMILFLPNQQVVWTILGETCTEGTWYERTEAEICFVYPNLDYEPCWYNYKINGGMRMEYLTDGSGDVYYEYITDQPLPCLQDYLGT